MLAHELLNSLTVIGGYAATLRVAAQTGSSELVAQCAEVIERHSGQMEALIRASQDVRLLELGEMDLATRDLDLTDAVREAIDQQDQALADHTIDVVTDGPVTVLADAVRLRQAVTSLLTNAAKFSPAGTRIGVSVSSTDAEATVTVTDEGPGIPADKREQVFERFGRLSHKAPGSGLGLYIARGVARLHGGELIALDVDSGAAFALTLPRAG